MLRSLISSVECFAALATLRQVFRRLLLGVSKHLRPTRVLCILILSVSRRLEVLCSTEFGVSKHWISKLVLRSLLLSVSKHLRSMVIFTNFKITFHVQGEP